MDAQEPTGALPPTGPRDWTDDHVARLLPALPGLDPVVEGAVTRMKRLSVHLRHVRERALADFGLERHEFDTLHRLAGHGGAAAPSVLAAELGLPPVSVTARLDALEERGLLARLPSTADPRRLDAVLTDTGRATWRGTMEVLTREEERLLGVLTPAERAVLDGLLRRVLLAAETPPPAVGGGS
ncbi:MarR family winged helix-turn-helix transcriptional regulator [Streptomyces termitum]|uniref:MarR family winged helix-turn-helix transcriptional regulator n=1 Tax=Streptomyces termitum TaxID=67368 RepID=UPI0033B717F5